MMSDGRTKVGGTTVGRTKVGGTTVGRTTVGRRTVGRFRRDVPVAISRKELPRQANATYKIVTKSGTVTYL